MFFFFNDPATTELYTYGHTLSLHDALPISGDAGGTGHPHRQIEAVAIGPDLARLEIFDTGADQEIALAALVDRAADLGFQFRDVAGEILGQRGGDQLGEAGALAEPEEQIAADPVGVAGYADVGEAHLGRARLVDRYRRRPDAAAGHLGRAAERE